MQFQWVRLFNRFKKTKTDVNLLMKQIYEGNEAETIMENPVYKQIAEEVEAFIQAKTKEEFNNPNLNKENIYYLKGLMHGALLPFNKLSQRIIAGKMAKENKTIQGRLKNG